MQTKCGSAAASQSKLCSSHLFTSLSLSSLPAPFLSPAPPLERRPLPDSFIFKHLSRGCERGPRHCDTLRRQYKYLISPNGNHRRALIVPHIIQRGAGGSEEGGGEEVRDSVSPQRTSFFDSFPVSPSPLPSAHLSLLFLLFMEFIFGLYVII